MTGDDLDEIVREFFADRDFVREFQEARQAAEAAPPLEPCIIPEPEFPRTWPRLISGIARYPCTVRGADCSWSYEVDTIMEDSSPLVLLVSGSMEDLNRALTERADQRATELRAEIEGAFREHFARVHPGQEPPDQVERAVREEMERRQRVEAARR
ncbi:hypothetical protein ACKI16_29285 [Streptomyces scabiei]|uniref:hypothetical protein n=1 Tax=Streptomyces scabiei TaxID=1930 RepID=UPI0038F713BA